jgi:hypothetical protein
MKEERIEPETLVRQILGKNIYKAIKNCIKKGFECLEKTY